MILAARACLDRKPDASRGEIKEALASNLCRCTGYTKIFEAVENAARRGKQAGQGGRDPVPAPPPFIPASPAGDRPGARQ
jgi:carbon-monoxide dehydrogenase small subunit